MDTYDLLGPTGSGSERFERFRRHAVAVRSATERIAASVEANAGAYGGWPWTIAPSREEGSGLPIP